MRKSLLFVAFHWTPCIKNFPQKTNITKKARILIGSVLRYVSVIKNIKNLKDFAVKFGILWKIIYFIEF